MTKVILGLSLAAVFAVSVISAAYASGHLNIEDAVAERHGTWEVHIEVGASIPTDGTGGNFGYAIPGERKTLIATSHPAAVDSVAQPPDEEFHTHAITTEDTDECGSGTAVATATKNEVGKLTIDDDELWITHIPHGIVGELDPSSAFSFEITLENGRVCVN